MDEVFVHCSALGDELPGHHVTSFRLHNVLTNNKGEGTGSRVSVMPVCKVCQFDPLLITHYLLLFMIPTL